MITAIAVPRTRDEGWKPSGVFQRYKMQRLMDKGYPEAVGIRVGLDNLNTHIPAVRYQTFPPEEA